MCPAWLTTTSQTLDTRLHLQAQLLYHTYLISTIHCFGVHRRFGASQALLWPTLRQVPRHLVFHLPFSDEMPTSSHQCRTHIACSRDATDAHFQTAPVETAATSILSSGLFRSVVTTIFVYFTLCFAYTLFVLAFGSHSGHWRRTIQELACEPAATAREQHFGDIPRFVFPTRASLLRHFDTLLYSHCLFCPLPYIDEATTPLSIRICILIYPWLALGEQSEGGLISMVGYLSIFASSSLGN